MGFGTEILFIVVLVAILLGPKRLPGILGQVARARAQLESATQNLKSQFEMEVETKREHVSAYPTRDGEQ
jgi:Sec-independent protein translocase protein TatA